MIKTNDERITKKIM